MNSAVYQLLSIPGIGEDIGDFHGFDELRSHFSSILNERARLLGIEERIHLEFPSNSSALSRVSNEKGKFIITVPIGFYLRTKFFLRELIESWNEYGHYSFSILRGVLDGFSPDHYFVPEALKPALDDYPSDSDYAQHFRRLWNGEIGTVVSDKLRWLGMSCMLQICFHEFAHIARNHFSLRYNRDFQKRIEELNLRFRYNRMKVIPPLSAMRGFEQDADFVQGSFTAEYDCAELRRIQCGGFNIGFQSALAACTNLAISDACKCQLDSKKSDYHLAPLFRFEIMLKAVHRVVNSFRRSCRDYKINSELQNYVQGWTSAWVRFQQGINRVDFKYSEEITKERTEFLQNNPNKIGLPALSGFLVGGPALATLMEETIEQVFEEYRLVQETITNECYTLRKGLTVKMVDSRQL